MATTTDLAKARTLVDAHAKQRQALIVALIKALLGLWGNSKNWDDPALRSALRAKSVTLLDSSLSNTRRQARSFATQQFTLLGQKPPTLDRQRDYFPRSGVTPLEEYTRPIEQYLYAISEGKSEDEALQSALERVTDLAETDVMLAERDELGGIWQQTKTAIGFRRIIHPELAKTGMSCGLCVAAATRFYSVEELMPIHGGCNCTSLPIYDGDDPGLKLNQEDLDRLYEAAGGTTAGDALKRVRVAVNDHGELGSVLSYQGQEYRNLSAVNRSSRGKTFTPYQAPNDRTEREKYEAMIDSSRASIAKLKALSGNNAQAIQWHQDLVDRLTSKLKSL